MEQVFRIEIPVEAVDKTDTAALHQLESTLQKIFTAMKQNKTAASDVFDAIERSATEAKAAMNQVESATSKAADSYSEAASAATDAGNKQKQAASNAESATQKLDETVSEVAGAYNETASAATEAGRKSGSAFSQAATGADKFTQRIEKSEKTLRSMFKEKFQLIIAAIDKASPVLKTIWNTTKSLAGKAWSVAVRMKDFITAPFRKLYNTLTSPITLALSVAGIGMSAGEVISTFNEFETGMSAVKALVGATDEEFLLLKQTAKDLGAETAFSASQASEGMQYLASAGWNTNEIVAAMPGLLDLAAAGATELGTAADIVANVMNAMGMAAGEASRTADVFAKTAAASNASIEDLGETLKYAAPIAHSFGMSLEEVSSLAGMMANAGIKGSMAGTAIRSSLMSMASPAKDAATLMRKLGLSFKNADGSMKDMSVIVRDLQGKFAKLTEAQKLSYAETLFGTYASSAWLGVINQGADAYDELTTSLNNAKGAAQEMAKTRLDNLAGDMEALGGAVETAKLELMEKLNPYLRKAVQWLTDKMPQVQATLERAIDTVIGKVTSLKDHLQSVFDSADFKNADGLAEKFFVAWDKIVAEPFAKWWSSGGRDKVLGMLADIGENMGKLLNGVIAGIFAAISGKEIDFEGFNLTGIGKAGAEAAKTFVSSFLGGLDAGGLAGAMPGFLKAGLLGFGAIKAGQGIYGITKTVQALKEAFGGVTGAAATAKVAAAAVGQTAATSAVGIGKASAVLGGLKTVLAAIPGWGWVAAGVITAAAIGIKMYVDAQERHRQELLHIGDAVDKAADEYRDAAQKVNDVESLISERKKIQKIIKIAREGLSDEEVDALTKRYGEIEGETKTLTINLQKTGMDIETIEDYAARFAEIDDQKKTLFAALISISTPGADSVLDLMEQYSDAGLPESDKASIEATLTANCASTEQASMVLALMKQYNTAGLSEFQKASILATLVTLSTGTENAKTVLGLMEQYSDAGLPESKKAEIEAALTANCTSTDQAQTILDLMKKYNTAGLSEFEKATILASLITLSVGSTNAETILDLMKKYSEAELESEKAEIIATLTATCDNQEQAEQLIGLFQQYDELESANHKITAELATTLPEGTNVNQIVSDLKALTDLANEQKEIKLTLDAANLSTEELDAYERRYQEINQAIIDSSNGLITQHDLEAGRMEEKIGLLQEQLALQREIARLNLETSVIEGRGTITEQVQKREEYHSNYQSAHEEADYYANNRTELQKVQTEFDLLVAEGRNLYARTELPETDKDYLPMSEYDKWEEGRYYPTIGDLYNRYTSAGGTEGSWAAAGMEGSGAFNGDIDYLSELENAALKRAAQYLADYTTQNDSLKNQYYGEKAMIEANTFKGSPLEGQSLEQVAAQYNMLGYQERQLFTQAMQAFSELNTGIDYLSNEDKVQSMSIWKTAYESSAKPATEPGTPETVHQSARETISALQYRNATDEKNDTLFTQLLKDNETAYSKLSELQTAYAEGKDTSELLTYFKERYGQEFTEEDIAAILEKIKLERQQIFNDQYEAITKTADTISAIDEQITATQQKIAELTEKAQKLQEAYDLVEKLKTQYGALTEEGKIEFANSEEGAAALKEINTALEGLGLDKITSLEDLSSAVASIQGAQGENTNAIDALNQSLGELTTDKIEALIAIEDALSTVQWNATNADRLKQIPEALKMSAEDVNRFSQVSENIGNCREQVKQLKTQLDDLKGTYDVTVNVKYKFSTANYTPGSVGKNAEGGIYDGRMLSWVAEDGPEAIIPLSTKRRDRGIDLWLQAGQMLGVAEFAEGGILAPYTGVIENLPDDAWDGGDGNPKPIATGSSGGNTFTISVAANPTFEISGSDSTENILDKLKSKQKELAEILGGALADQLEDIVANMV